MAIRQLNAKYNRYADLADGTSYSNLFTEDAEFNIVWRGNLRRARADCRTLQRHDTTAVHVTTEPEMDITNDTAQQRVRMLTVLQDGEGNAQ